MLSNLLNPKIAVLYVSLLPQFIDPDRGSVALQSLTLGAILPSSAPKVCTQRVRVMSSAPSMPSRPSSPRRRDARSAATSIVCPSLRAP